MTQTIIAPSNGHRTGMIGHPELRAWIAPPDMTPEEYEQEGHMLREINQWWQFAAGDWYWYGRRKASETGNARWGQLYARAADILGISTERLRDIAYVTANVPVERRNPAVSYSGHVAVAPLANDPQEQTAWLERAEMNGLTVAELREEIRVAKGQPKPHNACLECQEWLQAMRDAGLCTKLAEENGWTRPPHIDSRDAHLAAVIYLSGRFSYVAIRTGEDY